jgi:hypothetical protein
MVWILTAIVRGPQRGYASAVFLPALGVQGRI